ncbi:transketolase [Gluconacetobacter johannae DSM 13595]|uniref:Transketolase n=1 Tax=Gluconacetobacter johannae TaxID=112140 RepID=A0A7W4P3F7_9PROT|nr:transketolase [Gluconacetobacter johannae]MBB2176111.1 transketolase [Gluconacetobacter johannae]GBQ85687.1 transketolase [Gluconacetobacter johannae DSM 13595]
MTLDTVNFARQLRIHALRMVHRAKASHIGSCLSMADLLAVLYGGLLRVDPADPAWNGRDRFLLSKGHAAAIYYAALAERGFFPLDWLESYCRDGAVLAGHVTSKGVPGVEASTGSLGHGLPIACGMALGLRAEDKGRPDPRRVIAVLSDGELDEGSNWEAFLFAGHHKLSGLTAIIDYNKIQSFGRTSEVLDLEPLRDKLAACRWTVRAIDGHDHDAISRSLLAPPEGDRPTVIIAHTVKGKGVSFMENDLLWHYRSPRDDEFAKALAELGA